MLRYYTDFLNKHEGQNAFVVGAGTSLHGLDLSIIHDHVVVSVNSSIMLMPWLEGKPDRRFWISNDSLVRQWTYWDRVKRSHANRIVRDSWEPYFNEIPDFYQFSPRPTPEDVINPSDRGLAYCSSVPSAIDLALQMGCKKIFLLGVDQYMEGNRNHFYDFMEPKDKPRFALGYLPLRVQTSCYHLNDKAYPALDEYAKQIGAEVYNCNPKSRVRSFQFIPLDKVSEIL